MTIKTRCFALVVSLFACSSVPADLWINEIHYNNIGVDQNEFVEVTITNNSFAAPDLGSITLELYDSSTGTVYDSITLDDGAIRVIEDVYANFYVWDPVQILNGDGNAIALNLGTGVVQFLSWNGTTNAVGGFANGETSTDIGVSQNDSTPLGRSIGLIGAGFVYNDFSWSSDMPFTDPGINAGQSFGTAVPEPSSMIGLLAASLLLPCRRRRK